MAHWVWDEDGWLNRRGVLDFAGGIVLHTTAGVSALVSALSALTRAHGVSVLRRKQPAVLGRRKDFFESHGEFPPSNLPMACVGGALLWMGWVRAVYLVSQILSPL